VASHDENVCATAVLSTVSTTAWIGVGAAGGVATVGDAVTENWVAVILSVSVSVSGVVALVRDAAEAPSSVPPPLEVCATADDVGRGARSEDAAVPDRFSLLRDPRWEIAGAGETSGTSARPVVPSPASSSVVGPPSGVDE
jgi:hypothetical protein